MWSGANGGSGDDHAANSSYAYACCGGYTPPFSSIAVLATVGCGTGVAVIGVYAVP